jgi:hypothetical protein
MCTSIFGEQDVGRIEREMLAVLDFELGFTESDILEHHDVLSQLVPYAPRRPRLMVRSPLSPTESLSGDSNSSQGSSSSRLLGLEVDYSSGSSTDSSVSPHTPAPPEAVVHMIPELPESKHGVKIHRSLLRFLRRSSSHRESATVMVSDSVP